MSLINDALKKAQAQRSGGMHPPAPPADGTGLDFPNLESPPNLQPPPPPPQRGPNLWALIGIFVAIAILFAAGSALVVWGLLADDKAAPTATATPATAPEPAAPAASGPIARAQDLSQQAAERAAETEAILDAAPAAAVAESSAQQLTPPAEVTAAPPPAPTPAPVVHNPAVDEFLEGIEIRGMMPGGRVLIHDVAANKSRTYEPGAIVNNALQLRLLKTSGSEVTFIDHAGATYVKYF